MIQTTTTVSERLDVLAGRCVDRQGNVFSRLDDSGSDSVCTLYLIDCPRTCPYAGDRVLVWNGLERYECRFGMKVSV